MIKYGNANVEEVKNGKIHVKKTVSKKTLDKKAHEEVKKELEESIFNAADRI